MKRTPLTRRTPLRSRPKRDPVTPDLRLRVLLRDGGCLAVRIGGQSPASCAGPLTLDHVKDAPRMGRRAPSDERHLVTVWPGPPHRHRLGHGQPPAPAGLPGGRRVMDHVHLILGLAGLLLVLATLGSAADSWERRDARRRNPRRHVR